MEFGLPVGSLPYDAYLQVDAHPGECTDAKHSDWIEVKQYRHNLDQKVAASFSGSGAPASGQADHSYFWVCKEIDKASAKLAKSCLSGDAIKEITLELCTQTGEKSPFYKVKLENAIVAAIHTVASPVPSTGEALAISKPCEWIGFAYGKIEWTYTEMDHETGAKKGDVVSHWNRKDNTGG